jgi:carboxyl-terminal processing protease
LNKKTIIAIALVLTAMFTFSAFAGGVLLGRKFENDRHQEWKAPYDLSKARHVMAIIDQSYVDKVAQSKLQEGAVKGIIDALGDPFTHYLEAKSFESFNEETDGFFDGVGIYISQNKNKELVVVAPIEESPAEKAGVKANDIIVKIDGKEVKGMTEDQAVDKIRGKRGTQVVLAMRRKGEKQLLEFKLTRDKITFPNVTSKKMSDGIGYIRIHQFNSETSPELVKKYGKLKNDGIKGLILDLRGNPGGVLEEAVRVGSVWIDKGTIVKVKKPRTGEVEPLYALGGADTKTPVVVLVDGNSASASEIVAGALQDYKRGILIGETTFGKASVQTVIKLEDGSGILLTTNKYYTPKDRMIHKKGIKPDIVVKADPKSKQDTQMQKAVEVIKELMSGKRKLKTVSIDG